MQAIILSPDLPMANFMVQRRAFECRFRRRVTAEVHESGLNRHPLKTGGESRLPPKSRKLSESLNEGFLSEVVSVCGIVRHAKTDGIYTAAMQLKKSCESLRLAVQCPLNE